MPAVFLEAVYHLIKAEGSLPRLFWYQETTPHADKGSLQAVTDLCQRGLTLVVWSQGALAGMLWCTDVVPDEHAHISVWYLRRHWRHVSPRRVTAAVLMWLCETQHLKRVWASTIFPDVVTHACAFGAEVWETIPDYVWYNGQLRDVKILRVTPSTLRSDVDGSRRIFTEL